LVTPVERLDACLFFILASRLPRGYSTLTTLTRGKSQKNHQQQ